MRVLMVGPVSPSEGGATVGGVATVVSHLAKNLASLDRIELHLFADNAFCDRASGWRKKANGKGPFYFFPLQKKPANLGGFFKFFGFSGILKTYIGSIWSKTREKLLHKDPLYRHSLDFLYLKKIVEIVKPDLIHAHHAHWRPIVSWLASGGTTPIVTTLHSFHALQGLSGRRERKCKRMLRKNFEIAQKLIAVSTFVKEQAIRLGAEPEKLRVIPNGVDTDVFHPIPKNEARKKLNLDLERRIILFTGGLIERKGVDVLISAFKIVKEKLGDAALLYIVGTGKEKANLMNLVTELGLEESVVFTGYESELSGWYNACDVFVLPSKSEGLSISLLEAMACCKPVISSYPPYGKHDLVVEGETGLLVPYGDAANLAEKILRVLANENLSNQLAKNAAGVVKEKFDWKVIARKTAKIYQEVMKSDEKEDH